MPSDRTVFVVPRPIGFSGRRAYYSTLYCETLRRSCPSGRTVERMTEQRATKQELRPCSRCWILSDGAIYGKVIALRP